MTLTFTPLILASLGVLMGSIVFLSLVLAFAGALALDAKAVAAGLAPAWYGRLRLRLSAVVILLLLLGAAGIWRQ